MSDIFINYRRDDSAAYAGRIYDRLAKHFGRENCFMDIDHIAPGEDFKRVIQEKLSAVQVAVVLIGKQWLNIKDNNGQRRLDNPDDFVRLEIATLLARKIRVVPVLVGGADVPDAAQLPDSLASLAERNAYEISDTRFHDDINRLIQALEAIVSIKNSQEQTQQNKKTQKNKKITIAVGISIIAFITVILFLSDLGENITQNTRNGDAIIHQGTSDIITGTQTPPSHPEKTTISIGDHAQVGQIGDHNTQVNITGTTDIELAKQLGVTETAIHNFFKLLEQQKVPREELDHTLRKLAERHKELEKRVSLLESDDSEVNALQQQAREAIAKAEYEVAEDLLDKAAELNNAAAEKANKHYLKYKRSAAENMALKAETLHTRFALSEAIKAYEQAIGFSKEGDAEEKTAEYKNMLGLVLYDKGEYQKAIGSYELALASNLKTYGEDHLAVAIRQNNLGEAWRALGEYQKAIAYFELALASGLKTYGEEHLFVATVRNNLGLAWHALGEYQKAIGYFEQALASDLKTFGEDHPSVARDRNNLGLAWDELGEYQKAIGYFEQALASDLKTFGEDHPDVARDRNNLGMAWDSLGEHQKAIGYLEQALASGLKTFGEDHPDVATYRNNLGGEWLRLGEYQKAIGYLEQALASYLKTYDEDHPTVAAGRNNLGAVWHALGEYQKAIGYFELALATVEKKLGKNHPDTKASRNNLESAKVKLANSIAVTE